ncbi:MAG: HlyD family secretion protein [Prolixibacteraceae bacterium]
MAQNEASSGKLKIYIPLLIIVVLIGVATWYWYRDYSMYISTDDAHIESDNVQIGAKMLGRIAHQYAIEGDTVKKGAMIVELDSLDLLAQKNQTQAMLIQSQSQLEQAKAKLNYDLENIKVYEVSLEKAKEDYERAKVQVAGDVITKELFDHLKKAYETARAQLDAAKMQLSVSKAQIVSANAAIGYSEAQINVIETQLTNTKLYAPFDGVIARRWLLAGDIVQPGQAIFSLSGQNVRWVIVFMEETKLSQIHLNQQAIYTIDAFGDKVFRGKVFSIGASTASLFSLIPANNASGNFTKITQRVPVKISIDSDEEGKDVKKLSILPGMSVVMKIVKDK